MGLVWSIFKWFCTTPHPPIKEDSDEDIEDQFEITLTKQQIDILQKRYNKNRSKESFYKSKSVRVRVHDSIGKELYSSYIASFKKKEDKNRFRRNLAKKNESGDNLCQDGQQPDFLKQLMNKYSAKRDEVYKKIKRTNDKSLKSKYYKEIDKETDEVIKNTVTYYKENPKESTLDLHYFNKDGAKIVVDSFLNMKILLLKRNQKSEKELTIITGRGKHSPKNLSVIKSLVRSKLQERNLSFIENEGYFIVTVNKNSLTTKD